MFARAEEYTEPKREKNIMNNQIFEVTRVQFFDTSRYVGDSEVVKAYSANVFINNEFVIQVSGKEEEAHKATFAPSHSCYATTEEAQDYAADNYDIDEIIQQIEAAGFENSFYYLNENSEL